MSVKFTFDKAAMRNKVHMAIYRALERLKADAHNWWLVVVPVGRDRKDHKAGTLKDSWFAVVIEQSTGIALLFGADAPYTIYVELGTRYITHPPAPIRRTAGYIVPVVGQYLREELAV